MPCGWGVKASMVCVWVAGKTVWSPCYTRAYLSALRWWYTMLKALYKYQTLLYYTQFKHLAQVLELLPPPKRLCNARRLSVCLLATLRKTTERIFAKILTQMYMRTRKNWLSFGGHPLPDPDPGIFWRILEHCAIGNFSTIWLTSLDKLIGSSWKFCQKFIFQRGSPVKFWKLSGSEVRILSPDPDPDSA